MQGMYSMRSPAVKRLMKEAQELREPTEQFHAQPLDDNLFEWHFTIRGPADSEFDGGLYHGRIVLPPEYPMKPPSIIILTHNGRFEVNKKICLSISGHHPESWQPSWSIRTAMLAIIGFMPTHGAGALGSLDYTPEERKVLAKRSHNFKCSECGSINNVLKPVTAESEKTRQEIKELASQIDFKDEKEKNEALKATKESPNNTEEATDNSTPREPQAAGASSQQLPENPFGNLPGQFPFRMPFMPPFPMPQPQTQNSAASTNLAQVPRFPLPFVSPFLPPPPNMMHPGNGQAFPSMVPPWPPAMGMGTRPPFVPPNQGDQVTVDRTETTNVETIASATPTESQNDTTNVSNASSGATNEGEGEETQQTTQERQTADASSSSEDPSLRSHTTGVRRRLAASVRPEERAGNGPTVNTTQTMTSNIAPVRPRHSESPVYILFVTLLIVAILLLVLRRLYIMKMLPVLF